MGKLHSFIGSSHKNDLFSGYVTQYRISRIHFPLIHIFISLSNLEILAGCLNITIYVALILLLPSSYKLQHSAPYVRRVYLGHFLQYNFNI
jgi:hypothetical protein